jgi:hypothetical protein
VALSASVLSALAKAKLLANDDAQAVDCAALDALCTAFAEAVVEHVIAVGVVTIPPGVPVATAGGPAAQTGATTAPAIGSIT